jgi:hypothetical protein
MNSHSRYLSAANFMVVRRAAGRNEDHSLFSFSLSDFGSFNNANPVFVLANRATKSEHIAIDVGFARKRNKNNVNHSVKDLHYSIIISFTLIVDNLRFCLSSILDLSSFNQIVEYYFSFHAAFLVYLRHVVASCCIDRCRRLTKG